MKTWLRRRQRLAAWRENVMSFSEPTMDVLKWAGYVLILLVASLLFSCVSAPTKEVVTEVRTVEVPVEVVMPIPAQLTRPIPYPHWFGAEITIEDLIDRIFELYDTLDQANKDRATVEALTTPSQ